MGKQLVSVLYSSSRISKSNMKSTLSRLSSLFGIQYRVGLGGFGDVLFTPLLEEGTNSARALQCFKSFLKSFSTFVFKYKNLNN
jgi:hypothetical protein